MHCFFSCVTKLIFRSNTEEDDDFPGDFEEELALMDQNDTEIGLNETESQESTEQVATNRYNQFAI